MNAYSNILDQLRGVVEQHVPAEAMPTVASAAVVVAGVGVVLSVLGAKLARMALSAAFLAGCSGLGLALARHWAWLDRPAVLLVVGLGVAGSLLGYLLHRLWVGIAVGALFAAVGVMAFNHARIMPALQSYDPAAAASSGGQSSFKLLDPQAQRAITHPTPQGWMRGLAEHVKATDPNIGRSIAIAGLAWGVVGLLLGMLLTRQMLVLCTSVVGTALFAGGAGVLVQRFRPEAFDAALSRPLTVAGAVGGCLLASLILQSLLTRRRPARPPAPASA